MLALFVAFNVLNAIVKIRRTWLQLLCVAASLAAAAVLIRLEFFFYCIPQGLVSVSYCYAGYVLKKQNLLEKLRRTSWVYLILIPIFVLEIQYGFFDFATLQFQNIFWDTIGAGCSGLLLLLAGVSLGNLQWRCLDGVKQLGIYSYWLYAIHAFEMEALPWWYWERPLANHPLAAFLLEMLLKAAIYLLCCFTLKKVTISLYRRKAQRRKRRTIK